MTIITKRKAADRVLESLRLSDSQLRRVMALMHDDMSKGLMLATNKAADIKMYATYVCHVPDGSEFGDFLALDLGGTNFRVLLVRLHGSKAPEISSTIYMVPESVMTGTAEMLFDHIADCICKFMAAHELSSDRELPLGFTFSFPCKQESLKQARLVTWTKGFKVTGVEGEDVARLLDEACDRKGIKVHCKGVINDTVGTLMSCAFEDHSCHIGLIFGTGTNACYMESAKNVEGYVSETGEKQVIINTEWGAFGNGGALEPFCTQYDREVDKVSLNPGKQIYEKMISGMYLGEVARQVIVSLVTDNVLFTGCASKQLLTPFRFYSKYLSEIESDVKGVSYGCTEQILDELDITEYTPEDCDILFDVCTAVSTRAAYLSAAGIAVLLERVNEPHATVAIDGSLYRFHPKFHDLLAEKTEHLVDAQHGFQLMLSHDGSGKGAALVAAVACRIESARNGVGLSLNDSMSAMNICIE